MKRPRDDGKDGDGDRDRGDDDHDRGADEEESEPSAHPPPRSSPPASAKKPVFLDPAFPNYLGYLPPPMTTTATTGGNISEGDNDGVAGRTVQEVDRVDARTLTPETFFRDYVARRRPCVLCHLLPAAPAAAAGTKEDEGRGERSSPEEDRRETPGRLLRELVDHPLLSGRGRAPAPAFQVERRASGAAPFGRDRDGGPGSGRVERTLRELVLEPRRELYYLSTQRGPAGGDDRSDEDENAPAAVADAMPPPRAAASTLVDAIQSTGWGPCLDLLRTLAGSLLLESKHGWLGFAPSPPTETPTPSCSGLHHDFHDNFSLQLVGSKAWTLHPPVDYPRVPVHGTVQGAHGFNGLLSYRDNPTRADGVPLSVLLGEDEEEEEDDGDEESDGDKGEEGRVGTSIFGLHRGGGEEEEESHDEHLRETDDESDEEGWDGEAAKGEDRKRSADDARRGGSSSRLRREPPSNFSPVDMTLPASERNSKFPDYAPLFELTARVHAGEALYLPASWFHCVWSSACHEAVAVSDLVGARDTDDGEAAAAGGAGAGSASPSDRLRYHLAVNFWYHPPDRDDFHRPYRHDYWAEQQMTHSYSIAEEKKKKLLTCCRK